MQIVTGLEDNIRYLLEALITKGMATLLTKDCGVSSEWHLLQFPPIGSDSAAAALHNWEERTISSVTVAFPAADYAPGCTP